METFVLATMDDAASRVEVDINGDTLRALRIVNGGWSDIAATLTVGDTALEAVAAAGTMAEVPADLPWAQWSLATTAGG